MCAVVLVLATLAPDASAEQTPSALVEDFHAVLIRVMKAEAGFDDRHADLMNGVAMLFDLPTVARISVGSTWKELSDPQRQEYILVLHDLVAATYADRFVRYNNQTFVTGEVVDGKAGAIVKTNLLRSDGPAVSLDYYFRNGLVFDVVADGVSDLSLRRVDYNSIIKTEGFPSLLQRLRANTAAYRAADED